MKTTTTYKRARTIKDYTTNFKGYALTVPTGSIVSNKTACGCDDNYHFWEDYEDVANQVTGFKTSGLKHDLFFYGLNVPAEFCAPYEN